MVSAAGGLTSARWDEVRGSSAPRVVHAGALLGDVELQVAVIAVDALIAGDLVVVDIAGVTTFDDPGSRALQECFGDVPESVRVGGVKGVGGHSGGVGVAVIDGWGFVAVLEVVTADAVEFW
jgi:hypothetical protein